MEEAKTLGTHPRAMGLHYPDCPDGCLVLHAPPGVVPPMASVRRAMLDGQARAERRAYSEPPGAMSGLDAMLTAIFATPAAMLGEALEVAHRLDALLCDINNAGPAVGVYEGTSSARSKVLDVLRLLEHAKREADAREGRCDCATKNIACLHWMDRR